ncbi:MAG TPA: hypothetical protein VNN15_07120 [Solirubrobacterales bacterium]|nr:hypothetical protein [Solirubrobacterales bacterium]
MSGNRAEELREEISARAVAVEDNPSEPGQPTLVGIVATLMNEVAELKARVEQLEEV